MLDALLNFSVIAEFVAFLAALIFLRSRTGVWRLFIIYLVLSIATEIVGWYWTFELRKGGNSWIFNIYQLLAGAFTIWILSTATVLRRHKLLANFAILGYCFFSIANMLFFQGLQAYNTFTEILNDLIVIIYCCAIFYFIVRDPEYVKLISYEYFWLACGFLFSSVGGIVLFGFVDSLAKFYESTQVNLFLYVTNLLSGILYLNLIIAFICRQIKTR